MDTSLIRNIRASAHDATNAPLCRLGGTLLVPAATCRIPPSSTGTNTGSAVIAYDAKAALYVVVHRLDINRPYFICHAHAGWAKIEDLIELTWVSEVYAWCEYDEADAKVLTESTRAVCMADAKLAELAELEVYKLALAYATGHQCWPKPCGTCDMDDCIATAQDELRHGRRPSWL